MHVSRFWLICSLLGLVLCVTSTSTQLQFDIDGTKSAALDGTLAKIQAPAKTPKHHCENIHEAADTCAFARKYCSPESAGMVDYIAWYYCDMKGSQPVAFSIIVVWTALLFSTIGIASSDFFCPNLATIANSLGMSQSVAGVTFLAFGNGSPDVFSTFAAFKAHSGSLAIGELLGAAAFITSVVAGAMAIIAPFKVSRRSFLRDAGFFLVAVLMTMILLADGKLRLWESVLMIVFYILYVAYVLIGTYFHSSGKKRKIMESRIRSQYAPPSSGHANDFDDDDNDDDVDRLLAEDRQDVANLEANDSDGDSVEHDYQDINSSMSVTGRAMHTNTNNVRPSLLGALEFREMMTGLSEEGALTPNTLKSAKSRPRAHSTTCRSTAKTRRPNSRINSTGTGISQRQISSPEINVTRNHDQSSGREQSNIANPQDRLAYPHQRPLQISRRSHSSSRSEEALKNDDIASTSLRKHDPIELLSPGQSPHAQARSDNIPAILVDAPHSESEFFAKTDDVTGTPDSSPKIPSYESMDSSARRPLPHIVVPTEQHEEHDDDADSECVCEEPWCPSWWPSRVLPDPADLKDLLFPNLKDFRSQTYTQKLLAILALPSVFVLTITLPVVNPPINEKAAEVSREGGDLETVIAKDDASRYTAHRGWNRWLTSVQCLLTPVLVTTMVFYGEPLFYPLLIAAVISLLLLSVVLLCTSDERRPRFHTWFCFIGFAVSVTWISTIANEVVGTLQAFGTILGLSDAILGLTVFAVGNSLGDFVADVTVARMGFSQMAISGVFGGPMLNILLGIGISGIYINISKHHVYNTSISPTLIVSGASLLTTLVILLIAVPANDYVMGRKLGFVLCSIFLVGMVSSVLVEVYLQS